jgi:hypothetical protein
MTANANRLASLLAGSLERLGAKAPRITCSALAR